MSYVLASKEEERRHSATARELWMQWFGKDSDDLVPTTAAFGEEVEMEVEVEESAVVVDTTLARKRPHNLERDKRGNIIRACGIVGCQYKTGLLENMQRLKASKHGINVVWFSSDQDNCDFKANKQATSNNTNKVFTTSTPSGTSAIHANTKPSKRATSNHTNEESTNNN
ncbi:hypothetical protein TrLO_g2522 [Triparma laevis f. longispina]|uniref:Uncharacterized protein n=1 Tax=Triparma laevis f. longispina TaxID=1714387 RepID=A0A9W6ZBV8_9STRA|nr:hypothetical protein TrLO_g2522 [Triparma laevis f. longispina]